MDACLPKASILTGVSHAQVKNYIAALSDARNLMRKEHGRLQAEQAAKAAAATKAAASSEYAAPGVPLGFNPVRWTPTHSEHGCPI